MRFAKTAGAFGPSLVEETLGRFVRRASRVLLSALGQRKRKALFDAVLAAQPEDVLLRAGFPTMWGSIENLRKNGFSPACVIDVGAFVGAFSQRVHRTWPDAAYLMLEANPEKEAALAAVRDKLGRDAHYRIALLGARPKEAADFFSMETGSSVLAEMTGFERKRLSLPMTTLDLVTAELGVRGPYFLKLDVQGYELEVLRGAVRLLSETEVVLMEVSLLPFNEGAPLFAETVAFMRDRGYVAYDICGQARRSEDAALFQADLVFVRETSALRARRKFFAHELT